MKDFRFTLDSRFPARWPSIVRHFRRLLRFSVVRSLYSLEDGWNPRYGDLSPTIRIIKSELSQDLHSISSVVQSDSKAFPNLEALFLHGVDAQSVLKIAHERPTVHSIGGGLLLGITDKILLPSSPLPTVPIPAHLQSLELFIGDAYYSSVGKIGFPEGLESLKLTWTELRTNPSCDFFPLLPSTLRHLHLVNPMPIANSSTEIASLPRKLRSLIFSNNWDRTRARTPIQLDPLTEEHIKALPPQLTRLDQPCAIPEHLLQGLPQSLTQCACLPVPTPESIKLFPPNLTCMDSVPFDPKVYVALPSTLTSLTALSLPPNPQNGRVKARKMQPWPKLPASLTEIQGLNSEYLLHHSVPEGVRIIEGRPECQWNEQRLRRLPKLLTSLTLDQVSFGGEFAFEAMPRFLTKLTLSIPGAIEMKASDASSLPRTLKYLDLRLVHFTEPKVLDNFPSGLIALFLSAESLDMDCLKTLPAAELSSLVIHLRTYLPGLAHNLIVTLPRRLQSFQYWEHRRHQCDITDDDRSAASTPAPLSRKQ